MRAIIFWLSWVTALAQVQAPDPPKPVFKMDSEVTKPSIIQKVEPKYAEEARKVRLEGLVVLQLIVDPNGKARDIKVKRSLGLGLDEKAIEAVDQWRFRPGMKDGTPVAVYATIEVTFHLLDKDALTKWRVKQAIFDIPEAAARPVLVKCKFPKAKEPLTATIPIKLDIDEHGNPTNIQAVKPEDKEAAADMIAALRDWKFQPGTKDGSQVRVPVTFVFVVN